VHGKKRKPPPRRSANGNGWREAASLFLAGISAQSYFPPYCTVTLTEVVCVIDPDVAVTVIIAGPAFCGAL
jgi:hypothetical protein